MMSTIDFPQSNAEVRAAWNDNAAYWDDVMGEGNRFVEALVWPATARLLELQAGERVMDAACGNGLYARKLAALGAQVVAFDLAEEMIARARARTTEYINRTDYRVLDATDEQALLSLGEGQFDAVVCPMALMDMAEITPLMRAVARLLRPGGRFVFAVMHPCFNHWRTMLTGEQTNQAGRTPLSWGGKFSEFPPALVARARTRSEKG